MNFERHNHVQVVVSSPLLFFFSKASIRGRTHDTGEGGCTSSIMKLYSTSKRKPRIVMDGSTLYSWEEVFAKAEGHIRADGCIYTLSVDYENEVFPVSHMSELPLVCKLVAAYHNAIAKERLGSTHDKYVDLDKDAGTDGEYETIDDNELHAEEEQAQALDDDDEWDEELFGDRRVYDKYYEINAHLVPWNHCAPKYRTDKYGMYI